MNEPVKPGWRSGKDIVTERGITIYELFDLMKKGLQAYTESHKKVVDSDFLLKIKTRLFAEIKEEIRRDLAKPDAIPMSEAEKEFVAQCRYDAITQGIFDHPKGGLSLESFNTLLKESLSKVWDYQFKAVDLVEFLDAVEKQGLPSYEEIQKEKEQKAWFLIKDRSIPEDIKKESDETLLRNQFLENREKIAGMAFEDIQNEPDNSFLNIALANRTIISELAYSKLPPDEKELKTWYLINALAGSEEIQNEIADPQKQQEQDFKEEAEEQGTPDVSDYVKSRSAKGAHQDIIAYELHDPKGEFKLTYAQVARELGLGKDIQENQFDARKKRGERACKRGKKILQESGKVAKP